MLQAQSSTRVCPNITGIPMPIRAHFQSDFCTLQVWASVQSVSKSVSKWNHGSRQKMKRFLRALHLWFMLVGWEWWYGSTLVPVWPSDTPAGGFQLLPTQIFHNHSLIFKFTVLSMKFGQSLLWMHIKRKRLCRGENAKGHTSMALW